MAKGRKNMEPYWNSNAGTRRVRAWAKSGLTDAQIIRLMHTSPNKFYEWKKKNTAFCKALVSGKEDANSDVVAALYKRAVGFVEEDITEEIITDRAGRQRKVTKVTKKYYPPDTKAIRFWLKNRCEGWSDASFIPEETSDKSLCIRVEYV